MTVPRARVGDVLELQRRAVDVDASATYQEIGVRSFGKGLFLKPPVSGAEIGDKRVFRIEAGDLVISNVFAWEGAVGTASIEHTGLVGSHRFMTWTPRDANVNVRFLQHYFGSEDGLEQLRAASPGSAGRNRTLSIRNLEDIRIPLPGLTEQGRLADQMDGVGRSATRLAARVTLDPSQTSRLLPRLVGARLHAAQLPWARVGDLCTSVSRVIHPGDDTQGASAFVGLEHIAPHTGVSVGARALDDEKGRKLLFRHGEITYGYLRPYLNKVWMADTIGLCSVEQYVLVPHVDVNPDLLAHVLRSSIVLDAAIRATHNLQLPRLRLDRLMSIDVPDIRKAADTSLTAGLDDLHSRVRRVSELTGQRTTLLDNLVPAARNEVFNAMR